jgi:Oxidoreductase molybdopterin binding domain
MRLTLAELMRRPRVEITSIHQCCGSPLKPDMPTRRICNVVWSGVRLSELIADCDPEPAAQYVWSSAADYGDFEGESCDAFVKDLPINRVAADVLTSWIAAMRARIAHERLNELQRHDASSLPCSEGTAVAWPLTANSWASQIALRNVAPLVSTRRLLPGRERDKMRRIPWRGATA